VTLKDRVLAEGRRGRLEAMLAEGRTVRAIETHNPLSAVIGSAAAVASASETTSIPPAHQRPALDSARPPRLVCGGKVRDNHDIGQIRLRRAAAALVLSGAVLGIFVGLFFWRRGRRPAAGRDDLRQADGDRRLSYIICSLRHGHGRKSMCW